MKEVATSERILAIILIAAILGAIGMLGYMVATPKTGDRFTEFHILGPEGKAANYPTHLRVGEQAKVILGIVNNEHEEASYRVEVRIEGEKASAWVNGQELGEVQPIALAHEEKWEQEIAFVPVKAGEDQKVEFLLYREGEADIKDSLHLWVDISE